MVAIGGTLYCHDKYLVIIGGSLYCHGQYLVAILGAFIATLTIVLLYFGDSIATHPRWLLILWLATLDGVGTTLHYVVIGENLLQHKNEWLCKSIATVTVAMPPNQIFELQFCLS
jgi:hypothetical protein